MSQPLPQAARGGIATGDAPALEAVDVTKSLPLGRERVDILRGVSLRIARGELVSLVGQAASKRIRAYLGASLESIPLVQVDSSLAVEEPQTEHIREPG